MSDDYAANLIEAKKRLIHVFGKKIAHEIFRYSSSVIDTEKYVMFTKYVRSIVKEYLHAFLLNLMCDYWQQNKESLDSTLQENPLNYIQNISSILQKKLYNISLLLVGERIVFDYMSSKMIEEKLVYFFENLDSSDSLKENILELAKFRSEVVMSEMDASQLKGILESKKEILELVLRTYLSLKETIYQNLGYDVELEFKDISDFNFYYKDPKFEEGTENFLALEYQVMQEAIRIIEPEGNGDIIKFLENLRPETYGAA